jgi:signal transduction histidine kinase
VVENLLSFARIGKDITEYSDLNLCLSEIIKVVKHSLDMKQVELKVDLAEKLTMVRGDTRQLQQIFLNLINNAMGAMPHGGCLTITTSQSRKHVMVAFKDNGHGIKGKEMDHIYEPFFTTKPEGEGTGLGLFVSYGIVNKFGGSIHCVSQVSQTPGEPSGTTFTVKLVKMK